MSVEQLSKLGMRDLLLDQKLEDISKRAVPSKEEEDQPPMFFSNSVVSDINLRDLGIEEQLQKISRNTIKEVWGWKPTKIKSDVTQEMIQEYQDELERNSYVDPVTGRKMKYLPVNTDFTLEEPQLLQVIPFEDFRKIDEEKKQLVKLYQVTETRINQMREEIKAAEPKPTYQEAKRAERAGVSPENYFGERYFLIRFEEQVQRLQKRIDDDMARLKEIESRLYGLDKGIAISKENEQSNQAEIDRVRKANRELLKQKSDELNLLNRGKMNLQQQPNESDEDFKQRLLDVGQVEFDEKYITDAAERRTIHRFKENMKDITRNNMLIETIIKHFTNPNNPNVDRLFEYNKFFSLILKKFQEVYSKAKLTEADAQELIDFFDNVLAQDPFFTSYKEGKIQNEIDSTQAELGSSSSSRTPISSLSSRSKTPSLGSEPDLDLAVNAYRELTRGTRAEEDLQARALRDPETEALSYILGFEPTARRTPSVSSSSSSMPAPSRMSSLSSAARASLPSSSSSSSASSYKSIDLGLPSPPTSKPMSRAEILAAAEGAAAAEVVAAAEAVPFNPYQMRKDQLLTEFSADYNEGAVRGRKLNSMNPDGTQATRADILDRLLRKGTINTEDTYVITPVKKRVGRPIGSGFHEELPKFALFGRIAINPRALYYDNNLIVLNHKNHHINGYNKVKVSDHFVSAIMKLLNEEVPKHEDLKHFDLKEKELYDMVIHLAGLHKRVEHNLDRTKQSMKHRFELLDGEINAGNNNDDIKKELKDLVHKMAYAGMISHHEAHQYLYPNMRYVKHKKAPKSKK